MTKKSNFLLITIICVAFAFRIIGLNWDQNQHLHPDERFLTMVAMSMNWPTNLSEYLNTGLSKLNPSNIGFNFYVYGTFPVIFVKFLAQMINLADYNGLTLVGRGVSVVLDVGITFLIYLIAKNLYHSFSAGIWASFFYSGLVLPIQLAHFFAVDTFLVFFAVLGFYLLTLIQQNAAKKTSFIYAAILGLSIGLVLASKISGVIILPVFLIGFITLSGKTKISRLLVMGLMVVFFMWLSFRTAYPYLFSSPSLFSLKLNPQVLSNWQELASFSKPNLYYPPATMWISSTPLSPLIALFYWGLGVPFAVIYLVSLLFIFIKYPRQITFLLPVILILSVVIYQTLQFAKPLRYYYPAFPFIAIISGFFISKLKPKFFPALIIIIFTLSWPIAFSAIYLRPHSRVMASDWIYSNIPDKSILSCDYWDDCLPLPFSAHSSSSYLIIEYHLYDKDSPEKWQKLARQISSTDYIFLTSNRLYASITSVPNLYPDSNNYYHLLFSGQLGFTRVSEFTSRPHLSLPFIHFCLAPPGANYGHIAATSDCPDSGVSIVDDYAEETFTVYDHPKVTIFKNTGRKSASDIYRLVTLNTL